MYKKLNSTDEDTVPLLPSNIKDTLDNEIQGEANTKIVKEIEINYTHYTACEPA